MSDNLIMLPSGKPERKGDLVLVTSTNELYRTEVNQYRTFEGKQVQHLYQICSEKIKVDDWFVYRDYFVKQCIAVEGDLLCSIGLAKDHKAGAKLIIASTNPLLTEAPNNLPGIDPEVIANIIKAHNA